jgi:hypothetical protein
MMARVAAAGVGLLAVLAVPAALVLLVRLHGAEALLSLPPAEMAVLLMGLFLPPALLLLVIAGLTQRVELVALRNAFLRRDLVRHQQARDGNAAGGMPEPDRAAAGTGAPRHLRPRRRPAPSRDGAARGG